MMVFCNSLLARLNFKFLLQAKVKLGQVQVDLLQNVCAVLEPFQQATLQLSNDAACISEVLEIVSGRFKFLTFLFLTDCADHNTAEGDVIEGVRQRQRY